MEAKIYNISITDSNLHRIHGCYKTIREMFIPDLGLIINDEAAFILTDPQGRVPDDAIDIELQMDITASVLAVANLVTLIQTSEEQAEEALGEPRKFLKAQEGVLPLPPLLPDPFKRLEAFIPDSEES